MRPCKTVHATAALTLTGALVAGWAGSASASTSAPEILYGMSGFKVYCVQEGMNVSNTSAFTNPDGSFGPDTLKNVKVYQRAVGLKDDGRVGKNTGSKLWDELQFAIDARNDNWMTPYGRPISDCYQYLPTHT